MSNIKEGHEGENILGTAEVKIVWHRWTTSCMLLMEQQEIRLEKIIGAKSWNPSSGIPFRSPDPVPMCVCAWEGVSHVTQSNS